jgi:hypothetical protein
MVVGNSSAWCVADQLMDLATSYLGLALANPIVASTTLPHLDEIDIALFQTQELVVFGGLPNGEGRGEGDFRRSA